MSAGLDPSSPLVEKILSLFKARDREPATIILDNLENGLFKNEDGDWELSRDAVASVRLLLRLHTSGLARTILVASDDRVTFLLKTKLSKKVFFITNTEKP